MSKIAIHPSELLEVKAQEEFNRRVEAALNRTPEQIATARDRILALTPEPRPLPPGKTLEEVFVGAIPDDKTDEEVIRALQEIGK